MPVPSANPPAPPLSPDPVPASSPASSLLGLNLRAITRGALNALQPEEEILLYQSTGSVNDKGRPRPQYAAPQTFKARIQNEGSETLEHGDGTTETAIFRRFYLPTDDGARPAGLNGPLSRGGDMIHRPSENTWWLIVGLIDDFAPSGWVAARAVLQTLPPQL